VLLGIKGKTVANDDNSYEIVVEEDNSWISDEEMTSKRGREKDWVCYERKESERGREKGGV